MVFGIILFLPKVVVVYLMEIYDSVINNRKYL